MSAKTKKWLFWSKVILACCIIAVPLIFSWRAGDPGKFVYLGIVVFVGAIAGFMIWALNHGGLVEDAPPISTDWGGHQILLDDDRREPPPGFPDFDGAKVPRVPVAPSRAGEEEEERPHKVYEL